MEPTIRIFDENPYRTEFSARVLSVSQNEKGQWETVLDATCFFPEQGGQTPDRGILGGKKVIYVRNDGGVITHITEECPSAAPGDTVFGTIDFEHRFSNMQQHSGEHIFSGILHKKYGYENVGFHLSDHVVTLDTSGPLDGEQIRRVELEANRIIFENRKITAFFPKPYELDNIDFRSKDGIEGEVRLVEIDGVDICACCAPHVSMTGEIGFLKVVDFMNYKGGTRISILCGGRALEYINEDAATVKSLVNLFSCKREETLANVEKLKSDKAALEQKLRQYQEKALLAQVEGTDEAAENVLVFSDAEDNTAVRNAVNSLIAKHRGYCGIFYGTDGNYRFIIGSSEKDCNELMKTLRERGVKGGGSSAMVQGNAEKTREEIAEMLNF